MFTLLTVARIRQWMVDALPPGLKIDFDDYRELIPAFTVIALMSFTYNIGVGITAGLILYPFFKLVAVRWREIHSGLWMLCALSILFYIIYPYQ